MGMVSCAASSCFLPFKTLKTGIWAYFKITLIQKSQFCKATVSSNAACYCGSDGHCFLLHSSRSQNSKKKWKDEIFLKKSASEPHLF
jgi:hypothetical protein